MTWCQTANSSGSPGPHRLYSVGEARNVVILTMRLTSASFGASNSNTPGPPGPMPLTCNGLQFGHDAKGQFPTISALETYLERT